MIIKCRVRDLLHFAPLSFKKEGGVLRGRGVSQMPVGASPRVMIGWRDCEWACGRPVGRWVVWALARGAGSHRSSKQHLLKTWGTSHYSCSLTDRHPGRVGDGAQRGRRRSRVTECGQGENFSAHLFLAAAFPLHYLRLSRAQGQIDTHTRLKEAYRADSPEKKGIKDFCFKTTASILGT